MRLNMPQIMGVNKMTKKTDLKTKLDEALAADFADDWQARQEAVTKAKRDLFDALHPDQQAAINEALEALAEVTNAYRELYHPSFDDVVKLDASMSSLIAAFSIGE